MLLTRLAAFILRPSLDERRDTVIAYVRQNDRVYSTIGESDAIAAIAYWHVAKAVFKWNDVAESFYAEFINVPTLKHSYED